MLYTIISCLLTISNQIPVPPL